jgi:hypothetical protein
LIFKKNIASLVIVISIFGGLLTPVFGFNLGQQYAFATPIKGEPNAEGSGRLQPVQHEKGLIPLPQHFQQVQQVQEFCGDKIDNNKNDQVDEGCSISSPSPTTMTTDNDSSITTSSSTPANTTAPTAKKDNGTITLAGDNITKVKDFCLPDTEISKPSSTPSGFIPSYYPSSADSSTTGRIITIQQIPAFRPGLSPSICPPGVSPDTEVIRGFQDGGGGLAQPPTGKGFLVVEKIVITGTPNIFFRPLATKSPQDFGIDIRGPNGFFNLNPPLRGAGVVTVDPGRYSVFETSAPGYIPIGYQGDCRNAYIAAGETKLCTVWNSPMRLELFPFGLPPPALTITKYIIDDSGGTARLSDFDIRLTINDRRVTLPQPLVYQNGPYVLRYTYTIQPAAVGSYRVTENTGVSGYLPPTFLGDSPSGTIGQQDVKHIVIINNDRYR